MFENMFNWLGSDDRHDHNWWTGNNSMWFKFHFIAITWLEIVVLGDSENAEFLVVVLVVVNICDDEK